MKLKPRKLNQEDRGTLDVLINRLLSLKSTIFPGKAEGEDKRVAKMLNRTRYLLVWTAHPPNFIKLLKTGTSTKTIKGVIWFTGQNTIGIVHTVNEVGQHKSYIGVGSGLDEEVDAISIAEYGSKFPLPIARTLVKTIGKITNINY